MANVFFIGATGYIGGAVLHALLQAHPSLVVTALVRRADTIARVRALGEHVSAVQGTFDDLALIERLSRAADIVINTADCDTVPLTNAILAGLRKRVEEDGKPPGALLHTGGGAVFLDGRREGKADPNGRVWNDANPDDIRSITADRLHGPVDVAILQAGEARYIDTHIISPGGVIGEARGAPVLAGSIFIKLLIQFLTQKQRVAYLGEGTNRFYMVELNDLVDLYLLVFARVLSGADKDKSAYERYYIGAVNPLPLKTIMTAVGEKLARRTVIPDATPVSISVEGADALSQVFAADQRLEYDRAKSLGWNPKPVDMKEYMNETIDAALDTLHRQL
ncbi:hypothetical protein BC834DRAFT_858704 [Gloeopeniophorella convolvens]|nr:hypothetical protein BC834DRAFT_858704 [Gloeopeniophorella convolvens]